MKRFVAYFSGLFLSVLTILFNSQTITAQHGYFNGQVLDDSTDQPIPFTLININGKESQILTDIEGHFSFPSLGINQLEFSSPYHYDVNFNATDYASGTPLEIRLNPSPPKEYLNSTSPKDEKTILWMLSKVTSNNPKRLKPFKYQAYNKLTLSADDWDKGFSDLELILNFLTKKQIKKIQGDHYLFLVETFSETKYFDNIDYSELVVGNKVSGIESPAILGLNSGMQYFSAYDRYVSIMGMQYISPLHVNSYKRYCYEIEDTLNLPEGSVLKVRFNPKPRRRFDGLKGYLYINITTGALTYFEASPARQKMASIKKTYQSFIKYKGINFPYATKTVASAKGLSSSKHKFWVSLRSYNTLPEDAKLTRKSFDEIALQSIDSAGLRNPLFWKAARMEPFSEKDSNTYLFYNNIGNFKKLDRLITLGEKIYNGQIPFKFVSFDLKNTFAVNPYEAFRSGVGFHTNERFSKLFRVGLYGAYGTGDKEFKYGGDLGIRISKKKDFWINYVYQHDLKEAGSTTLIFDRVIFASEALRKYGVFVKDFISKNEINVAGKAAKYMKIMGGVRTISSHPTYDYQYRDYAPGSTFGYDELFFGLRYAYGEKYFKSINSDFSFGSNFPVLYFQYTRGLNNGFNGEFNYQKIDVKIIEMIKLMGLGKTTAQLVGGYAMGDLTYSNLYNSKGAEKQLAVVVRNAFETMKFNEFLSDKHISLFLNYELGLLFNRDHRFNPSLELAHNMGIGSLSHPEYHKGVEFKTMEKGYIESGLIIGNIINIRLLGIGIGLGAGIYYRYGSYAYGDFTKDSVFKFSLDLY